MTPELTPESGPHARTPATDPFTPGYGAIPSVWAGRQAEFAEHGILLERVRAGIFEQARLVTGDRGVGKTAFLAMLEDEARDDGHWAVRVAAGRGDPLVAVIAARLRRELAAHRPGLELSDRLLSALGDLTGVEVGVRGVRVERRPQEPPAPGTQALADALEESARLAADEGRALLLLIDEAQNTELDAFAALWLALQEAQNAAAIEHGPHGERLRRHLPIAVYVAGLPGVLELGRRAGVTFSERVRHLDFGLLPDPDVRAALRAYAGNAGVGVDADALDLWVQLIGGYPYFLHLYGRHVWRAGQGPVITLDEVGDAAAAAGADLDRFYGERLRGLGDLQHDWLRLAAALPDDDRTVAAVAERLGRRTTELGSTYASLLGHGLIRRLPARGRFAFAVPGLDRHLEGAQPGRSGR